MRTVEQTTQEVLELAAKHFQVAQGSLAADDDFFRKLGINSLQRSNCFRGWRIISASNCQTTKCRA